jgi:hypothetical protein
VDSYFKLISINFMICSHEELMDSKQEWTLNVRNKKDHVYPVSNYWNGFTEQGKERWYIELSNGSIIAYSDPQYKYWLKKLHKKH